MKRRLLTAMVSVIPMFLTAVTFAQHSPGKEVVSVSAKWNKYDAYIHQMMDRIETRWRRVLIDSRTSPPSGTFVAVKFMLDSRGRITEILDVGSTSSEPAKQSCIAALTLAAPYEEWTKDMVATLGSTQELTFRFEYE